MTKITTWILLMCLLPNFSCKQLEKHWVTEGGSTSGEGIIAGNSFQVTEISSNKIGLDTKAYGGPYPEYVGMGKIKYLGKRTLSEYSLDVSFILYDDSNESFTVSDYPVLDFHDGFGSVFETKLPWEPNQEMLFDIHDGISNDDIILYPIRRVEVVYHILASDPFGHSYDEKIKTYDITDSWLKIQNRFKSGAKKVRKTLPYVVERPAVEKRVTQKDTSSQKARYGSIKSTVPAEFDTSGRIEQKAKWPE